MTKGEFIPFVRCEADDGRGSDFGRCCHTARRTVTHQGRMHYVCQFHFDHYEPEGTALAKAEGQDG